MYENDTDRSWFLWFYPQWLCWAHSASAQLQPRRFLNKMLQVYSLKYYEDVINKNVVSQYWKLSMGLGRPWGKMIPSYYCEMPISSRIYSSKCTCSVVRNRTLVGWDPHVWYQSHCIRCLASPRNIWWLNCLTSLKILHFCRLNQLNPLLLKSRDPATC